MTYRGSMNNPDVTPQSETIPGRDQVRNNAGGAAFAVTDWERLDRWLILGSESNTYYQDMPTLSRENAGCVLRCLHADGLRTVRAIVDVSDAGRAPKNDAAIFALALAFVHGDEPTRKEAELFVNRVCRIGTHLFQWIQDVGVLKGGPSRPGSTGTWSRRLRRTVANWYLGKSPADLAYQLIKYQEREGVSHRDLIIQSHPVPVERWHISGQIYPTSPAGIYTGKFPAADYSALFNYAVHGWPGVGEEPHDNPNLRLLWAFEHAKRSESPERTIRLIREYGLTHEMIKTEHKKSPGVWEALLERMPMTAMVRNLGTMSKLGLVTNTGEATTRIVGALGDPEQIRKARIHPVSLLSALRVYAGGHGVRSQAVWPVSSKVVDALDAAFYLAYPNVETIGKRFLLALDISGSMELGEIAGLPGLTPRDFTAAMALVLLNAEPNSEVVAYTSWHDYETRRWNVRPGERDATKAIDLFKYRNCVRVVPISPRQRLPDAIAAISGLPMGGTDCALPFLWAAANDRKFDCVVSITDNETWAGEIHPFQALRHYRASTGIGTKLVAMACAATAYSIADPDDAGSLNVVGADSAVPQLIAQFAKS